MSQDSFKEFVLDQLVKLDDLSCKSMFGGYGLYQGVIFFGVIYRDRLYFKTDESSRLRYVKYKSKPFQPHAKQTLKTYYEVPVEILEDQQQIIDWAKIAIQAALNYPRNLKPNLLS